MAPASKYVTSLEEFLALMSANKQRLIVADFTATWCGPCKQVAPYFEKRALEAGDAAVFVKVDVDQNDETAKHFNIQAMPTFLFIRDEKITRTIKGSTQSTLGDAITKELAASATAAAEALAANAAAAAKNQPVA
jgi:thioredoxin 1